MKMNPVLLLSGTAGGRSGTLGLNALREAGGNDVNSLGYRVTYAIANLLLRSGDRSLWPSSMPGDTDSQLLKS